MTTPPMTIEPQTPARSAITSYLTIGQSSLSALVAGTKLPAIDIRCALQGMLAESLITEHRITCPNFKVTVYRLAPATSNP